MREDDSRRTRLRLVSLFSSIKEATAICFLLLLLVIFINVTSINYMLCYKSFSLFKAILIFLYVTFAVLRFDFIIADWIFLCFT